MTMVDKSNDVPFWGAPWQIFLGLYWYKFGYLDLVKLTNLELWQD
ncbi:hypothetical protein [Acinetobacter terrae]|nr:hypothetical protein [Acinetobacter terrae]